MTKLDVGSLPSPGLFRVVRVFRLGRLLRFFEAAKGIRQLLFTILKSAPALSNVGTLLFLITFIYAVIGMNLFGHLKFQGMINPVVNFQTFGSSFCVLFRIATAAGWNGVLDGAMVKPPRCNDTITEFSNGVTKGDCGHPLIAVVFFVSYILLIVLIIINMYIAVILENFSQAQAQDQAGITEDDIEVFYETWQSFDPKARQFILYHDLTELLDQLLPPFRIQKPNYWFLEEAKIPLKEGNRCHCLDVLHALIKHILGEERCIESEDFLEVMKKVEVKYKVMFPQRFKEETKEMTNVRMKREKDAASAIQRFFRWYLLNGHLDNFVHMPSKGQADLDRKIRKIESLLKVMLEAKIQKQIEEEEEEERWRKASEDDICEGDDEYDNDDDENRIVETSLL